MPSDGEGPPREKGTPTELSATPAYTGRKGTARIQTVTAGWRTHFRAGSGASGGLAALRDATAPTDRLRSRLRPTGTSPGRGAIPQPPPEAEPEVAPAEPAEPAPDGDARKVSRQLRDAVRKIDGGYGDPNLRRYQPTGIIALDNALAGGGLPTGAVTECCGSLGSGRTRFVTQLLPRILDQQGGVAMLLEAPTRPGSTRPRAARAIRVPDGTAAPLSPARTPVSGPRDLHGRWYAPGFAQAGVPLDRLVIIQPRSAKDAVWAAEQALISGAVRALVLRDADPLDIAAVRRLQLAAEEGNAVVLLMRPAATAQMRASAAAVRLLFEPLPPAPALGDIPADPSQAFLHSARITITRCRGGGAGTTLHWHTPLPATADRLAVPDLPLESRSELADDPANIPPAKLA